MLESFWAVPLHFAIELLGFVLCVGGSVLVLSRPTLAPGSKWRRGLAAMGFAALAVGQAVHGASLDLAATDGEPLLSILTTVGLIALLASLLWVPKAAAPALLPVAWEGRLLLGTVALAVLVSGASFTAASRARVPALRRLGFAMLFWAGYEAAVAQAPDASFGLGNVDPMAYVAHGSKIAAFVFLAAWLWTGVRSSISARFVASFAVLLVAVVVALSVALTAVLSDNVADSQLRSVDAQLEAQQNEIEDGVRDLLSETGQIAALPEVRTRLARGDDLGALVNAINSDLDFFTVDFVALLDESGAQLELSRAGPRVAKASGEKPSATRLSNRDVLSILGSPVVGDLIGGVRGSASFDVIPGRPIPMSLAGAPVRGPGGGVAGYLVTGRFLDQLTVDAIATRLSPVEASIVTAGRMTASTLSGRVGADELVPPDVARAVSLGSSEAREQSIGSRVFFSAFGPLEDALGTPTGAVLVLSAPSSLVVETREDVSRVLFLIAIAAGALVLLLAWLSGRRITRPIRQLTATARTVREGDLSASAPVSGDDEVGQLGATFNEMTGSLLRMTDDLKAAAREEHDLRERIEKIIQSMADGLVAVDAEARVVALNAEAENMTGVDFDSVSGAPIEDVIVVLDSQGQRTRLPLFDVAGGSTANVFLERKHGEPVPVTVTSAVLRDEKDYVSGSVAIMRDMTREREVERLKSEFLSNISHELRTPLTPIKGFAEILSSKQLAPDKTRQFATGILDSTTRLERIVGLLVDYTALESGRLAPSARPVDVAALLEKLRSEWARRDRRHEFVTDVVGTLPWVLGDERLLKRSLEEIIDNAVKFSPHGGTVRLAARRGPGSNGDSHRVEVVISDEGIGIERDDLHKVFSDFRQLDGSQTRAYGGLGLGLAFVRRIVEAHSGTVDVQSEPERGTRLIVSIPAAEGAPGN